MDHRDDDMQCTCQPCRQAFRKQYHVSYEYGACLWGSRNKITDELILVRARHSKEVKALAAAYWNITSADVTSIAHPSRVSVPLINPYLPQE
jgi:hypothetical protein